jgi:hypothetical protein
MLDLSKKFETHRHTVARQLAQAGIEIRPQRKMTPELLAQATVLYNHDQPTTSGLVQRVFGHVGEFAS